MSTQTEPEIILFDLACTKNVCFSPAVWRTRFMLNYKHIPYSTIFLEFPDIEPKLKGLGLVLGEGQSKYTVPAIQHVPTKKYIMDSTLIAQFLEATYPDPPLPLTSELGVEIESKTRAALGPVYRASVMPREIDILSPRAQEFFRRTREAALGHPLEDLLSSGKEELAWSAADDNIRSAGELMRTHKAEGPFVLGSQLSYTDFAITGFLQSARLVDESVFQRIIKYPGYGEIYEACSPHMSKKD